MIHWQDFTNFQVFRSRAKPFHATIWILNIKQTGSSGNFHALYYVLAIISIFTGIALKIVGVMETNDDTKFESTVSPDSNHVAQMKDLPLLQAKHRKFSTFFLR